MALSEVAMEALRYPYHVGTTRTADTFFAGHPRPGSSCLWGLRAGGMAVCLDNLLTVSGDEGKFNPDAQLEPFWQQH